MIAKPFFDRFKSSDQDKLENNLPSADEKLLLKLLGFSLNLENDNNTLIKIARSISFNLDVDTVCISEISNNKAQLRQIFHNEENYPTTGENWNLDSINSTVITSRKEQYYENVRNSFANNPLVLKFNAESLLCVPALDDDGCVTTIINIFHPKNKNYSHCEIEVIRFMAQRADQFFQHEKSSNQETTKQTQQNKTDRDQQLEATTDQLNATNKSLESLSFAVSHELRAPLRSMDNFSKALVEDFSKNLPEDAIDYVSRIRKSCTRMGDMIDDLLWLSKVTRRKIEQQNIDFSKLVEKIAKELVAAEENPNIELNIQGNLFVIADKGLLKIVIQHLLSNAIKFTRQKENAKIEFFAEQQGDDLVFAIRDNGRGFDMAYYDQLFEPFKQLHSSNKFDGTGIGLATVERIIERHHGKIWAESDTDAGATFYFTLPSE